MTCRTVAKIITGNRTTDGAGVRLVRVLGNQTIHDFDPFLMLDAFDSRNPDDYVRGFPMHPHRGIETFTYLIHGEIEHRDSLGNRGTIHDGECQWMTAGSGILHQEMPKFAPHMLGLQLWINLPRERKMIPPKYHNITKGMIPIIRQGDASVAVVAGENTGIEGAARGGYVDMRFLDISLNPNGTWNGPVPSDHTAFAYLLEGSCAFETDGTIQPARHAVLFSNGDEINVFAGPEGARFVLVSGMPLRESVAWGGPIVMNTEEELVRAFQELEDGTFIRHG